MNTQAPILNLLKCDEKNFDFQPKNFSDYIGQNNLKQKLEVYTKAAKIRQEPLDHMLLFGPPGLGKTTLSHIMANVMEVNSKICSGPLLNRTGDLVAILSNLEAKDILFIDEIHRIPTNVEEILYSAMERFQVEVIIGQGASAQVITLPIQPFTLIGATTKAGLISAPLRSRFGIIERIDFYNFKELALIIMQNAKFLGLNICKESAEIIARASRGTPRIAKKIVRRIRDFTQVNNEQISINNNKTTDITNSTKISNTTNIVKKALKFLDIDEQGLTNIDYALLKILLEKYNGGPTGLETIASLIGEDTQTLQDVIEPYLLRQGLLEKTQRGRQIPASMISYVREILFKN